MREKYESLSLATLKDLAKGKRIEGDFYFEKAGTDRAHARRRRKGKGVCRQCGI